MAALDDEGGGADPRLLRRGDLVDLDPEPPALGPAAVHPQHHVGPVCGVGAAGAGVDLADGVALVVVAGEEGLEVEGGQLPVEVGDPGHDLPLERLVALLPGQLVERLEVGQAALQPVDPVDVVLHPGQLGSHLAGGLRVVPQRGVAGLPLELGQAGPGGVDMQVAASVIEPAAEVGEVVGEVAALGRRGYTDPVPGAAALSPPGR